MRTAAAVYTSHARVAAGNARNIHTPFPLPCMYIAIHRKFQTRRVAEDSTRLYGEAAQHRMRLSVDGYTSSTARVSLKNGFAIFLGCPVRRRNTV